MRPFPCRLALLVCALVAVAASPARAQAAFDVDAVTVRGASPARPRLDVYTRVPYGLLNFTNVPTGFQARYGVTLNVYAVDARGRQRQFVVSKSWDRTIPAATYSATRTNAEGDRTTQAVDLSPGRYLLQFELEDASTRRTWTQEATVQVRDVSAPVALSDLALVDRYDEAANTMLPRVSNRLGTDDRQFLVYYELYAAEPTRVRVVREVLWARNPSEVAYTTTATAALRPGRNQFVATVPVGDLRAGEYIARVRLQTEAGVALALADKRVEVQWEGLAQHVRDLNQAISQLRYIAKDRDVRHIREAATDAERANRFRAFWARLDPTPGTDRNERMEEYYYRVDFANRRYGSGGRGWESDRGSVVIQFGEPDEVIRNPQSFGARPTEVWYYNRLRRRYVFVDKTGFGDFQLLVPVWDERTRM